MGGSILSRDWNNPLRLWSLDWALDDKEPVDWDDGAQPYLENFLTLHSMGNNWFGKWNKPNWDENDFQQLLYILVARVTVGCAQKAYDKN